MPNINPPISLMEMSVFFEYFPQKLTSNNLYIFLEWFNLRFFPSYNNKIYYKSCFDNYSNYIKNEYNEKPLSSKNFSKLFQLALIKKEIKQGYRSDNPNGSIKGKNPNIMHLKYYIKKRDAKSFYFLNFVLK